MELTDCTHEVEIRWGELGNGRTLCIVLLKCNQGKGVKEREREREREGGGGGGACDGQTYEQRNNERSKTEKHQTAEEINQANLNIFQKTRKKNVFTTSQEETSETPDQKNT